MSARDELMKPARILYDTAFDNGYQAGLEAAAKVCDAVSKQDDGSWNCCGEACAEEIRKLKDEG